MQLKLIFSIIFVVGLVSWCSGQLEVEENVEPDVKESSDAPEKLKYIQPVARGGAHFVETFDSQVIGSKWIKSKAKKDGVDESLAKYDGEWSIESCVDSPLDGDMGLVLKSKAKHHAISAKLDKTFKFSEKKPLIVQYEVKFQNAMECGGAYVKLLADEASLNLDTFFDKTSFSIMFGPDKCGTESKYHLIIRYKNPVTGVYEEKHAKKSELVDAIFSDGKTHLFTLVLSADSKFKMYIDSSEVNSGSLLSDLNPAIVPAKEIVDPNDVKPENWDDREKIPDPDAVKPDEWDENEPKLIEDTSAQMPDGWLEEEAETVADPSAVMPEDWDVDTDGEWEAPKVDNPKCKDAPGCGKWKPAMINNPKYKGKWRAPMIENMNYQGQWEARKIPNPEYFETKDPFSELTPFSAVGLELWSMTDNIYFDNFIITDEKSVADQFGKESWLVKKTLELRGSSSSDSVVDGLVNATKEKPWLWAVYLLVILVPIVLVFVFCCGKSAPTKSESQAADAGQAKKTDAVTRDDEEEKTEEQMKGANEVVEEESVEAEAEPKVSKEDLEEKSASEESEIETEEKTEEKKSQANKRRPRKD